MNRSSTKNSCRNSIFLQSRSSTPNSLHHKENIRAWFEGNRLCPCCYFPTLSNSSSYEICDICNWEDDSQDDNNANVITRGSNEDYSLKEAIDNFRKHYDMFRVSATSNKTKMIKTKDTRVKRIDIFNKMINGTKPDRICCDSVVLATLLNEPEKSRLETLTIGVRLVAPGSLPWEVGNALSASFKKKRITDVKLAHAVLNEFGNIPIHLVHIALKDALDLCFRRSIYAYDAYMILCARQTQAPLLTLDRRLAVIAEEENIKVVEV